LLTEDLIEHVLSSPFVDNALWNDGLGGDRRDPAAARLYLSLPVSSRPQISYLFDSEYYLEEHPDVREAGADPFIHFVRHGCKERRSPHPLINIAYMTKIDAFLLPELPSTRDLYDVLHYDVADPSPYFMIAYYREQLTSRSIDTNGFLEDFLKSGLVRGMMPNPCFDPLWYYRQLEGAHDVWSGLRHFVTRGDREAYAPSPDFSAKRYRERYPDVAASGTPPLYHYLTIGRAEGRSYISEQSAAAQVSADLITRFDATVAVIDEAESTMTYETCRERISRSRQNQKDRVSVLPLNIVRFAKPLGQIYKLTLPQFDNPRVSILIPVYNELPYTVDCISSILDSSPDVSYEVVIADDASTDAVVQDLRRIPNIKYLRQASNAGFLRNCNSAFHSCKGRYILLLNNDTQLLPGALDALVEVLESDCNVAAVGPKMLYPNGRLQEAGCSVDRDGVSTMVGLFANPGEAAYNYTRDVHYCSGAGLLVRRSELGDELFDETFIPAYCEDTDLCLRLLSNGRRVVYCPKAEIVHHLSVSTNKQSASRRLQLVVRNQQKLARKWSTLLEDLNRVRTIAFYLPQFHPTEANDFYWGKGFTEWSNVAKSRPAYVSHYQPHLPADLGFYDLRVSETIERQTALARRYGIAGFCVYYYNFGRHRALDKAFEAIVADQSIDFPYCVCWANENWTRHWDGGTRELIFQQSYDDETMLQVIHDATRYAADPRYLRVNGRPLFLVYRPLLIPNVGGFAALCRQGFREAGFDDVHLVYIESMETIQKLPRPEDLGFDACVEFPPQGLAVPATDPAIPVRENFVGTRYDYELTVLNAVARVSVDYKRYPAVFPSWDNTPRQPLRGDSFIHASPEAFQVYVEEKLDQVTRLFVGDERLLFVNAWNEWAEGTHLEPDQKYGHRWLEAIHNALLAKSQA
jgi:GT2 family glycosyltransferase